MARGERTVLPLGLLLAIPGLAYVLSFAVLAIRHGTWNLSGVVIHEGGAYTLFRTVLYASHFLGHVPVHTVLALFFVGTTLRLSGPDAGSFSRRGTLGLAVALLAFLALCVALALTLFGLEDTLAYVLQRRQRVLDDTPGGAWMLHLPSTVAMFLFIPVFIAAGRAVFGRRVAPGPQGRGLQVASIALGVALTLVIAPDVRTLARVFVDPRYLGHAVREIATFPVTYFPVPLYFILRREPNASASGQMPIMTSPVRMLVALGAGFVALFAYECAVSLSVGLGAITQKPAFAGPHGLGVPYLLASHTFEHVLDSIYFGLLCLVLFGWAGRKTWHPEARAADIASLRAPG